MIGTLVAALVVARFRLARGNERHAALRAIAGFGAHHVGVHGTGVFLADATVRCRVSEPRGHVEVKPGRSPDNYGQQKDADKTKMFANGVHGWCLSECLVGGE